MTYLSDIQLALKKSSQALRNTNKISEEIAELSASLSEKTENVEGRILQFTPNTATQINISSDAEKIIHTGKNLFVIREYSDTSWKDNYVSPNSIIGADVDAQTLSLQVISGGATKVLLNDKIPVSVGDKISISTHCVSHTENPGNPIVQIMDNSGNVLNSGCTGVYNTYYKGFVPPNNADGSHPSSFVFEITSPDVAYFRPGLRAFIKPSVPLNEIAVMQVMCVLGDTYKDWTPGIRREVVLNSGTGTCDAYVGVNTLYSETGNVISAEYTAGYAVVSVNGKSGIVELDAEDVGAMSKFEGETLKHKFDNNFQPMLTDVQNDACKTFANFFINTVGDSDSFLFFTDPHLVGDVDVFQNFQKVLNEISAVYNNTPTSLCICGGDWLNNSNTIGNASWILGKIDGEMKRRFDDYVLVVGNHDTNYQGYEYMQSGIDGTYDRGESLKCKLPIKTIRNIWHREHAASYFTVDGDTAKFYIFDSGLDWYPEMDEYRWAQVDWFAMRLLEDKHENHAGILHIGKSEAQLVDNITKVVNAYNNRTTITLNGKDYDYSNAEGAFRFIIAGHSHLDSTASFNGIPVITTTNLMSTEGELNMDLMLADYGAKILHIVRVGNGENRTVEMADASN